jgi:hypothetical protein
MAIYRIIILLQYSGALGFQQAEGSISSQNGGPCGEIAAVSAIVSIC